MFLPSGCKIIRIRKFDFVTKTQILLKCMEQFLSYLQLNVICYKILMKKKLVFNFNVIFLKKMEKELLRNYMLNYERGFGGKLTANSFY